MCQKPAGEKNVSQALEELSLDPQTGTCTSMFEGWNQWGRGKSKKTRSTLPLPGFVTWGKSLVLWGPVFLSLKQLKTYTA